MNIRLNENISFKVENNDVIHIVIIGTKPDIIKQAPLILELKKRKEKVLIIHTGQHYDWNLSGGLEEEFGLKPDINLGISGTLYEQQSQIINKLGLIFNDFKKKKIKVIPYIYGDTTTALAAGIASFSNLISTAHVEAGLRTMSPPKEIIYSLLKKNFSVINYYNALKDSANWNKGSYEPYPEQFDTRAAAPSVGIHFTPARINSNHLLAEGYAKERVFIVGNPVVDAIDLTLAKINKSKIFEKYPVLAKGSIIRFCIHRRENVSSYQRFKSIYDAMILLIKEGRTVLLISLGATEKALQAYNLKKDLLGMVKKYQNFIYSGVWPYYLDTIAVMNKCSAVVTDSGSIQEETVALGIPGIVLRFNSDRPEAIFQGNNLLAPPIKGEIIYKIIKEVADNKRLNEQMRKGAKLYGENVSQKMVKIVKKAVKDNSLFNLFELMEHERLGLKKLPFWQSGGIYW